MSLCDTLPFSGSGGNGTASQGTRDLNTYILNHASLRNKLSLSLLIGQRMDLSLFPEQGYLPPASFSIIEAMLPFPQCIQEFAGKSEGPEAKICPRSSLMLHAKEDGWQLSGLHVDELCLIYDVLPNPCSGKKSLSSSSGHGGGWCCWPSDVEQTLLWTLGPLLFMPHKATTSVAFLCTIYLHSNTPTCKVVQDIRIDATNRPRVTSLYFSLAMSFRAREFPHEVLGTQNGWLHPLP